MNSSSLSTARTPFIRLLVPLLAGILYQEFLCLPIWGNLIPALCGLVLWSSFIKRDSIEEQYHKRSIFGVGLFLIVFSIGAILHGTQNRISQQPSGFYPIAIAHVNDKAVEKTNSYYCPVTITALSDTNGSIVKYKEKIAVNNINLTIKEGELFALLGTNGAGKTTTIKMLSTLILPTEGEIKIAGYDIAKDSVKIKEIVNVSPQETAIAPNLTVKENLDFMAGVYKIKNKNEKIDELVKTFKLQEVLKQKAKTLSGGWQRKLSIAISLINDPKVLFLDEPTLGLDVLARRELWTVIESLKGKITIILTTHYMEEAESLSDRVGIMDKGKLIAVGTVKELMQKAGTNNFEEAFVKIATGGRE